MKTKIGVFDSGSRTVQVTFYDTTPTGDPIAHQRAVNACLKPGGVYDAEATAARVEEVARGVAVKIAMGAISNPPPAPTEPTEA